MNKNIHRGLALLFIMLIGCAGEPPRQFNVDDQQDRACYNKPGGRLGYCDKVLK